MVAGLAAGHRLHSPIPGAAVAGVEVADAEAVVAPSSATLLSPAPSSPRVALPATASVAVVPQRDCHWCRSHLPCLPGGPSSTHGYQTCSCWVGASALMAETSHAACCAHAQLPHVAAVVVAAAVGPALPLPCP